MIGRRNLLQLFALAPMISGTAIVTAMAKPTPKPGKFYYEVTYCTQGEWAPFRNGPLRPSQIDENFYSLDQRIAALEENR